MLEHRELFTCRGGNYTITLTNDRLIVKRAGWVGARTYELPVHRVRSLIIERKSVIPFATATLLLAIAAVVSKYNALWFLINLTPESGSRASTVALLASMMCAIPTMTRTIFVNVFLGWDGDPPSFRARFVSARSGRRLAKRFQEVSVSG